MKRHTEQVPAAEQQAEKPGWWQRVREVAGRNKGKLALGAAATSVGLMFATSPMSQIEHDAVDAWPWYVAGASTDGAMFVGLGMMAAGIGSDAWKHPMKLSLPELAQKANSSKLFEAGYWTNYVAALGTSAVMIAGVVEVLPPSALGMLAVPLADAASTVVLRASLRAGIQNNLPSAPMDMPGAAEVLPQQTTQTDAL